MLQIHILFFLANIGVEDLRFRHRFACILPQHHCKSTAVAGEVRQAPHLAHKIGAQCVADQCAASHNSRTDNDGANNIRTILNVSAAVLCGHIHIIIHGKGNGLSLVILIQRQVKIAGRPEIKHHTLGNLRLVQRHGDFCTIRHKAGLLAAGLIGAGFQCIGHINVAVFHSKGAAGHGQGMIDDRLILLPLCRKHLITRQDKLTPGVIELTLKTQPSSKLVAFSCGSCFKLHALLFTGKNIAVIGSCVAIASIQVVLEAVHTGSFLMFFQQPAAVIAGLRYIPPLISLVDLCPLRMAGGKGFVMLTIGIGVRLHLAVCPDQLTVQMYICFTLVVSSCFTAIAKHLRTGRFIPGCSNGLRIIDIDDVLIAAHVAVVDVQRSFIVTEH